MPRESNIRSGVNKYTPITDILTNPNFPSLINQVNIDFSDIDTSAAIYGLRLTQSEYDAIEAFANLPVQAEQYDAKVGAYRSRRENGSDVLPVYEASAITQAIYYRLSTLSKIANVVGTSIDRIGIALEGPDGDLNPEFLYMLTVREHKAYRLNILDGLRPLSEPYDDGAHTQGYNPSWNLDNDYIITLGLHDDVASQSNPTSDELAPYIAPLIAGAAAIALPEIIEAGATEEIVSGLIGEGAPFKFFGPSTTELPLIGAPKIRALPPPIEIEIPGVPAIHVPHVDYNVYSDLTILQDGTTANSVGGKGSYLGAKRKITLPGIIGVHDAPLDTTAQSGKINIYAPGDTNAPAGSPTDRYVAQYVPANYVAPFSYITGSLVHTTPGTNYDLDALGTLDWHHFGSGNENRVNGGLSIGNPTINSGQYFGDGSVQPIPYTFSWQGASNVSSGCVAYQGAGTITWSMQLIAEIAYRVRIWVSCYQTTLNFIATTGNNEAPQFTDSSLSLPSGSTAGYYDLQVRVKHNTTLNLSIHGGNVQLFAMAVGNGTAGDVTPPSFEIDGLEDVPELTTLNGSIGATVNGIGGYDIVRNAPAPVVHVAIGGIEGTIQDVIEDKHVRRNINLYIPPVNTAPPPPSNTPVTKPTPLPPPPISSGNNNPPQPTPPGSTQACFDTPVTLISDNYLPKGSINNNQVDGFVIHWFDDISTGLNQQVTNLRANRPDILGPFDRIDAWVFQLQTTAMDAAAIGPINLPAGIYYPTIYKGKLTLTENATGVITAFKTDLVTPALLGGMAYEWLGSKQTGQTDNGNFDNWNFACKFWQNVGIGETVYIRGLLLQASCLFRTPYALTDYWDFTDTGTNNGGALGRYGYAGTTASIITTDGNTAPGIGMGTDAIHTGSFDIDWTGYIATDVNDHYVNIDLKLGLPGSFNVNGVAVYLHVLYNGTETVSDGQVVGADNVFHNIGLHVHMNIPGGHNFTYRIIWDATGGQALTGDNMAAYAI